MMIELPLARSCECDCGCCEDDEIVLLKQIRDLLAEALQLKQRQAKHEGYQFTPLPPSRQS